MDALWVLADTDIRRRRSMRTSVRDRRGSPPEARFEAWVEALFERHLAELTWSEIARALAALSQDYVQRRHRLRSGQALAGRGKRAAFNLYYAPRHFLLVQEVLRRVGGAERAPARILDLGCGTGVAGAAWAAVWQAAPAVLGVDTSTRSLAEARLTYRALGVRGRTVQSALERLRWPAEPLGIVAAFTLNELDEGTRARALPRVLERGRHGGGALVVEPLAGGITPWWDAWAQEFVANGGRADLWHLDVEIPEPVARLGRSARLDPRELGARTLWLAPESAA
jgi:SAM-dependent methyltransferase